MIDIQNTQEEISFIQMVVNNIKRHQKVNYIDLIDSTHVTFDKYIATGNKFQKVLTPIAIYNQEEEFFIIKVIDDSILENMLLDKSNRIVIHLTNFKDMVTSIH